MKGYSEALIIFINASEGSSEVFGNVVYKETNHDDALQFSSFIYRSIDDFELIKT